MSQETKSTNHRTLYIILITLIVVLIGTILFLYLGKEKSETTLDELTIEKEILARDYQDLALEYDSIKTSNDTINELLSKERERITQLLEEIKTIKSANAAQIREYKKELTSLRQIMKSFVFQIDSLNARNQTLIEENKEVKTQFVKIKDSYKVLEEEKKGLAQKVEIASRLETRNIEAVGLNNKDKETSKINRIDKLRVCFTILKNLTAPVGDKIIYLRIVRPDEELLLKSKEDVFDYEDSSINFSSSRIVEYGGNDLDVCIYYDADEGELMEGTYIADIFTDGNNIGTVNFELK